MAGKPIATVTGMHVCPMCNGTVPHVGGPIIGPGAPNILINGKPAALMGDKCTCVGPPDVIVMGNPSVLFNGVPVACMGDMTAHGGSITVGDPTVMIGTSAPVQSVVAPLKTIPFPKINILDRIGAVVNSSNLKEAEKNIEKIKEETQKDTLQLTNLQWQKDGTKIDKAIVGELVILTADVSGIEDENTIGLNIYEKDRVGEDDYVTTVCGIVKDSKIRIEWDIVYMQDKDDTDSKKEEEKSGYTVPEYVFKGITSNTQETTSPVLKIMGWAKSQLVLESTGEILSNTKYILHCPDGSEQKGTTDDEGYLYIEEMKMGKYKVSLDTK